MKLRGYYSPEGPLFKKAEVNLNEDNLNSLNAEDSYKVMGTIRHELRHGYQHSAVDDPEKFIVSQETIKSWKDNIEDYKKAEDDYFEYQGQPIEIDVRSFDVLK